MTRNRWKDAGAILLVASAAVAGASLPAKAGTEPGQAPAPIPQARTLAGVVVDDRGRPAAGAWVGHHPQRDPFDTWIYPAPSEIREHPGPFGDPLGRVLPPGPVGKYFELRDARGGWNPIHPDDITRWDARYFEDPAAAEQFARTHSPYKVRVARGAWAMANAPGMVDAVARADDKGRFSIRFQPDFQGEAKLHFASRDFQLQEALFPKGDQPDGPVVVKLRPTRLVRARVIKVPKDDPQEVLFWKVFPAKDSPAEALDAMYHEWLMLAMPDGNEPAHIKRHIDVRLPFGRWTLMPWSENVHGGRIIDVPPGEEPLDLSDVRLEDPPVLPSGGQPAAELEATDLDGQPVRLADFLGKVVVLDFWATWEGHWCMLSRPRLIQIQERFRDKPLVILAMHDASVDGPTGYLKAVEPIRRTFWGGAPLPFRVLLDRPPPADQVRRSPQGGERKSGRTAEAYGVSTWPTTFVIDHAGKLVGKCEVDALEGLLEDLFGLPHAGPRPPAIPPPR